MSDAVPPKGTGPLARLEARLAWGLLMPTILAVAIVVLLPLLAIFWISVKPVGLADLRPPEVVLREDIRGDDEAVGDEAVIRYRLRNSSQDQPIRNVSFRDTIPDGLTVTELDPRCTLDGADLFCDLGDWEGGFRDELTLPVTVGQAYLDAGLRPQDSEAAVKGRSSNVLTNTTFTLENFARVFDGKEFWTVLWTTLFYTVFGTIGALLFGLFAALLLNKSFRGQGILRGLYLFPYVSPVIGTM